MHIDATFLFYFSEISFKQSILLRTLNKFELTLNLCTDEGASFQSVCVLYVFWSEEPATAKLAHRCFFFSLSLCISRSIHFYNHDLLLLISANILLLEIGKFAILQSVNYYYPGINLSWPHTHSSIHTVCVRVCSHFVRINTCKCILRHHNNNKYKMVRTRTFYATTTFFLCSAATVKKTRKHIISKLSILKQKFD